MKPFNLQEALAGKPVVTQQGTPVTQIVLFKTDEYKFPLYALVEKSILTYTEKGLYNSDVLHEVMSKYDLFMASEKKQGWINIYPPACNGYGNKPYCGDIHATKEEAKRGAAGVKILDTIFIEYED